MRVLFVGNSYTFHNDLPQLFAELSRSGGHDTDVAMVAEGGWTLAQFAASGRALQKIGQEKWDVVVLQEQSIVPSLEQARIQGMYPAVRLLDEKIRQGGGRTVLFMTWGRRDGLTDYGFRDFGAMQAGLAEGYLAIARELGLTVAPVGAAWASDPRRELWADDGSHPSLQGSYLAACVFYATLYRQSPEGLKFRAGLPRETAALLQKTAARTVLDAPAQWDSAQ